MTPVECASLARNSSKVPGRCVKRCSAAKPHKKSLTDHKVGVECAALVKRKRGPNRSLTNWNQVIRVGACGCRDDRKIISLQVTREFMSLVS